MIRTKKNKKGKVERLYEALAVIMLVLGCMVMFLSLLWQAGFKEPELLRGWCENFDEGWKVVREDGSLEEVSLPVRLDSEKGETIIFQKVLPAKIPEGTLFCLLTGKGTSIYVGEEERFVFSTDNFPIPGGNVKNQIIQVPLSKEDAGKVLILERNDAGQKNGTLGHTYWGDSYGIWNMLFHRYGAQFCAALLLIAFSLVCFVVLGFIYKQFASGQDVMVLCVGIFAIAGWSVFDNCLYQYIFHIYYVEGTLSYLVSMLAPYPFLYYVNRQQHSRYLKLYTAMTVLLFVDFMVMSGLHFTGLVSFVISMPVMNLLVCIVIAGVLYTIGRDLIRGDYQEYRLVTIGVAGLGICGAVEILQLNLVETNRYDGLALVIGLYFLLILAVLQEAVRLREVREKIKEAVRANELKSNFLANMSHEIRTPINAIMGMDDMILREQIGANVREYAMNIQSASMNLLSLINGILDFSKIEAGRMELVSEPYELASVLNDVIAMTQVRSAEKGLAFDVQIDEQLPESLYGDELKIRQILLNLLNNAAKYTERGRVSLRVKGMEDREKTDRIQLCFVVQDTGIGILEEEQEKLFQKFERLDEKRNRHVEGTGLGLAITGSYVDMMQGTITVESEYGKGSRFEVMLPQKVGGTEKIGNINDRVQQMLREKETYQVLFQAPKAEIMVVDDNRMNLEIVKGLLRQTRMQIETCQSGREMLQLITRKHYDLILLDHMMPEMDGLEALQEARKVAGSRCGNTPVVAMTANAIKGVREKYLKAGFDDYISKPIEGRKLEEMILRYLNPALVQAGQDNKGQAGKAQTENRTEFPLPEPTKPDITNSNLSEPAKPNITNSNLPEIEEFDFDYAMRLLGDASLLRFLLDDFKEFLGESMEKLQGYWQELPGEKALDNYRIEVHAVKSTAATVGALLLSKLARLLELAARGENLERIERLHPVLMEEMKTHKERLEEAPLGEEETE